jgi:hypothetical protein
LWFFFYDLHKKKLWKKNNLPTYRPKSHRYESATPNQQYFNCGLIGCFEEILCSTSKQKSNHRKFRHPYLSISVNALPYFFNHFLVSKQT